jgi:hypothetical protein
MSQKATVGFFAIVLLAGLGVLAFKPELGQIPGR